jgi:hypothetical protein
MILQLIQIRNLAATLVVLAAVAHLAAANSLARVAQGPELPAQCTQIAVDEDQTLIFHAYAIGVQIYRWTGSSWELKAPDATLYSDPNYRGKVGTHYAGPIWESNSGGLVKATRVNGCDVDASSSIQWLLLQKAYTEGPGIFSKVSYIQRVNTVGGLKPVAPGIFTGEERRIPYTAEYYFYKSEVE